MGSRHQGGIKELDQRALNSFSPSNAGIILLLTLRHEHRQAGIYFAPCQGCIARPGAIAGDDNGIGVISI